MNDQDFLRYSRQLLLAECSLEQQTALAEKCVLIVGLGGLGSPVAHYLAAAGVGELLLADHDNVDISNLQRQILYAESDLKQAKTAAAVRRLRAVNHNVRYKKIPEKLTALSLPQWVAQADLVLDCSDNFATRKAVNQVCVQQQKPLISAAAIGFNGQLIGFLPPFSAGCYQCLYPDETLPNLNCKTAGVLGPIVGVVGSLQALEALKYLLGLEVSCAGKLLLFDGKTLQWQPLNLTAATHCPVCSQGRQN